MTLVVANNAEGGTSGTTVTTSNSGGGSGNAFDGVTGTGVTFDNAQAAHGSLSYKVTQPSGSQTYLTYQGSLGTLAAHYGRALIRLSALPSAATKLIQGTYVTTSEGKAWSISMDSTGHLRIVDQTDTTQTTFTAALSTGTWYRLEWHITSDPTAGAFELRLYAIDSSTVIEGHNVTGINTGAGLTRIKYGNTAATPTVPPLWFDDIAVDNANWIGPVSGTPASQTSRPVSDINVSGLTGSSAVSPLAQLIGEVVPDNTTYVETGVSPSAQVNQWNLNDLNDPGVGLRTGYTWTATLSAPGSSSSTFIVAVYQGATLIASRTHTSVPTSATDYPITLTDTECARLVATGGVFTNLILQTTITAS